MRKAVPLLTTLFLIFSLFGCASQNEDSYKQLCADAISVLSAQNECHYTSHTLEGESEDSMKIISSTEYWVSGSNWLSFNPDIYHWELSVNNTYYSALSESGTALDWQLVDYEPGTRSPVHEIDLNQFSFESASNEDGKKIITFASDEKSVSQGITTSDIKAIFTFSESGNLISYEYRFCITKDENASPIYYSMLMEYHAFEEGNIEKIIQNEYNNAIKNIK